MLKTDDYRCHAGRELSSLFPVWKANCMKNVTSSSHGKKQLNLLLAISYTQISTLKPAGFSSLKNNRDFDGGILRANFLLGKMSESFILSIFTREILNPKLNGCAAQLTPVTPTWCVLVACHLTKEETPINTSNHNWCFFGKNKTFGWQFCVSHKFILQRCAPAVAFQPLLLHWLIDWLTFIRRGAKRAPSHPHSVLLTSLHIYQLINTPESKTQRKMNTPSFNFRK